MFLSSEEPPTPVIITFSVADVIPLLIFVDSDAFCPFPGLNLYIYLSATIPLLIFPANIRLTSELSICQHMSAHNTFILADCLDCSAEAAPNLLSWKWLQEANNEWRIRFTREIPSRETHISRDNFKWNLHSLSDWPSLFWTPPLFLYVYRINANRNMDTEIDNCHWSNAWHF